MSRTIVALGAAMAKAVADDQHAGVLDFLVDADGLTPEAKELKRHAREILEERKSKEGDEYVTLFGSVSVVNGRVCYVQIKLVPLLYPRARSDYEIQKEHGVCALIVRRAGCKYAFFAGAIDGDEVARISCGSENE